MELTLVLLLSTLQKISLTFVKNIHL